MRNIKGSNQYSDKKRIKIGVLELKTNTYIDVLFGLLFIAIVLVVGHAFKLQEIKTLHYSVESKAYAKQIKTLTTYHRPSIDETGKAKAELIIKQTWRNDWQTGMAIASCESGYREKVVNSIGATGYFQILVSAHNVPVESMQDGYANSAFAYILFKEQGFNPWVSSAECWKERI